MFDRDHAIVSVVGAGSIGQVDIGVRGRPLGVVILDALSERAPETQRHVAKLFGQDVPLDVAVITSRTDPNLGQVDCTTRSPICLAAGTIGPFIVGCLDRMNAVTALNDDRAQLQLAERIVTLAECGGRKAPLTPLSVTLFVESAPRSRPKRHDQPRTTLLPRPRRGLDIAQVQYHET